MEGHLACERTKHWTHRRYILFFEFVREHFSIHVVVGEESPKFKYLPYHVDGIMGNCPISCLQRQELQ